MGEESIGRWGRQCWWQANEQTEPKIHIHGDRGCGGREETGRVVSMLFLILLLFLFVFAMVPVLPLRRWQAHSYGE